MSALAPTWFERLGIAARILKRPLLWSRESLGAALQEARSPAEVRAIFFRTWGSRRSAHLYAIWDYEGEWDASLVYEVLSESTTDLAGLARKPGVRGEAALAWLDVAMTREQSGRGRARHPLERDEKLCRQLGEMVAEGRIAADQPEIVELREQCLRFPSERWRRELLFALPGLTVEDFRQACRGSNDNPHGHPEILVRWLRFATGEEKREPWGKICQYGIWKAIEVFESLSEEEKGWMKPSDLLPLLEASSAENRMRVIRAGLPVAPRAEEAAPAAPAPVEEAPVESVSGSQTLSPARSGLRTR